MASQQLQNIGNMLAGFGAGIQGNLPQFQALQLQREQMQAQQAEKQQKLVAERQKTMFTDMDAMLNLLDKENYDGVVQLGMQRLQLLKNFPDADPSDTQRITQLAIAAKNGDEEAKKYLRGELEATREVGRAIGVLEAPKVESKVVGDYLVDAETGRVIFDASKEGPRERAEDENGVLRYLDTGERVFPQVEKVEAELSDEDKFNRARMLRSEITGATKEFEAIANSWDRISASADDPSAAGDLALIFNYMKMLDPGSTVREGEFANAQNAAGIPDRLRNIYNRARSGERLTESQRMDFFAQAENIFTASKDRADQIVNEYVRVGERYGLSRDDVVIGRGKAPEIKVSDSSSLPSIEDGDEKAYNKIPSGAEYMIDGVRYRKR